MKKSHKGAYIVGAIAILALGAGVFAYEEYYKPTTIAPGISSVSTPMSGSVTLSLPTGAKSWTSAMSGVTALTAPSAPTTNLTASVSKGSVLTIVWVDASGTSQTTVLNFT